MTYEEEFYKKRRINSKLERLYVSLLITGLFLFIIGAILTINIDLEVLGAWIVVLGIILIAISLVIYINAVEVLKRTYEVVVED